MTQPVIVAIHQPNYLPWLGFFDKANKADVLVFLDNVQFPRRGWSNRVRIKTPEGPAWLTVPVSVKGRYHQMIAETEIRYQDNWVRKHLSKLERNYRSQPFYDAIAPVFEQLLTARPRLLGVLNGDIIQAMCELLKIDVQLISGSTMGVSGASTQLLIDLTKAAGGTTYLSGEGGRLYQEEALYDEAGVELRFQEFDHPVYEQRYGEFVPGMSIFDILCCSGVEGTRKFLRESRQRFVSGSTIT